MPDACYRCLESSVLLSWDSSTSAWKSLQRAINPKNWESALKNLIIAKAREQNVI
jgi:hypothetical protein